MPSVEVERGKAQSKGEKTLERVSISPSQNGGFTVEHSYRLKRGGDMGCYCPGETYTFESRPTMIAHVTGLFPDAGKSKK